MAIVKYTIEVWTDYEDYPLDGHVGAEANAQQMVNQLSKFMVLQDKIVISHEIVYSIPT